MSHQLGTGRSVNCVVWVKWKAYPWWPAVVQAISRGSGAEIYTVELLGTHDRLVGVAPNLAFWVSVLFHVRDTWAHICRMRP